MCEQFCSCYVCGGDSLPGKLKRSRKHCHNIHEDNLHMYLHYWWRKTFVVKESGQKIPSRRKVEALSQCKTRGIHLTLHFS